MASRGLNVFVNIGAKLLPSLNSSIRGTERGFDRLSRHVRLRAAEMKVALRGLETHFSRFATHVSMPAAMLTAVGARAAYTWSQVGNELQAVTLMSAKARKGIEDVARALPGDPAENLRAALDLARTGFNAEQIRGTLATTIKLSRADSSVDTASAADIMTNVMKGMRLPDSTYAEAVASAERVANNIAIGAAQSSSDVRLMGESFKYAAPLAARLGINMETMTAYFMTMADAGIKGSESGVALRSGFVRLLKPTKAAMAVLDRYNMSLGDYVTSSKKLTAGDFIKGLKTQGLDASGQAGAISSLINNPNLTGADLVARLTDAVAAGLEGGADAMDRDKISDAVTDALTSGGTKVNFTKFLEDLTAKGVQTGDLVRFFDVRQGARLATLTGAELAKNMRQVAALMRVADGSASFLDKMYAMQLQGAVGPWMRLQQSFGNLIIAMAESGVMDTVADAMDRIAKGIMGLSKSSPGLLKFIAGATVALAALAPIGWGLMGIWSGLAVLKGFGGILWSFVLKPLVGLGPMLLNGLARLAPWIIRGILLLFTPAGLAVALAAAALYLVYKFRDEISAGFTQLVTLGNEFVNRLIEGISASWGRLKAWFAGKWNSLVPGPLQIELAPKGAPAVDAFSRFRNSGPRGAPIAGKRAGGGSVTRGKTYLVGERGPELWRAHASGHITPNNRLGGGGGVNATFNIYGATDPQAVAMAVRAEFNRLARGQAALLSD